MMRYFIIFLGICSYQCCFSQSAFDIVPLGVKGGGDESNLSCYAVAVTSTDEYICLDAGTVRAGIQRAIEAGFWQGDVTELLRNKVKGYLISHPHLDHVAGLVINAPDDSPKSIYGTTYTLDILASNYFSWKSWANFSNRGETPRLNKYNLVSLEPKKEIQLEGTELLVTPYDLSHSKTSKSSAFLLRHKETYLLYLGDTGSDTIEESQHLTTLWEAIAPLIISNKLKGIFIETSFDNSQPDTALFGHFTPKWLTHELLSLSTFTGKQALKEFPIIITHRKPEKNREGSIQQELEENNPLGVNYIFPIQGRLFRL